MLRYLKGLHAGIIGKSLGKKRVTKRKESGKHVESRRQGLGPRERGNLWYVGDGWAGRVPQGRTRLVPSDPQPEAGHQTALCPAPQSSAGAGVSETRTIKSAGEARPRLETGMLQ